MADYEDYDPEDQDQDQEREAPEVYRKRRIIAAIIAILAIILVVWGLVYAFQKVTGGSEEAGGDQSTAAQGNNFESFSARPSASEGASTGAADPSASASAEPSAQASGTASASAQPSDGAQAESGTSSSATTPQPSQSTEQAVQACSDALTVTTSVDQKTYAQGQQPVITTTVTNGSQNPCTVDLGTANATYQITSGPANVYSSQTCSGQGTRNEAVLQAGAKQTLSQTWDRGMNVYGCGESAQQARTGYYWVTATVDGVTSKPALIVIQ